MLNSMIANNLGSKASAFYDSLTISKAVFVIRDREEGAEPKQYPVMINPSTISVDTRNRIRKTKGTGSTGGGSSVVESSNAMKQSVVSDTTNTIETRVSMELIYDLAPQYELVKSRNGTGAGLMSGFAKYISSSGNESLGESLVGGLSDSVDKYSEVHLLNDNFSYVALLEACQKQKYVGFVWGPINLSGNIEGFKTLFSMFTRAGAPFRGKVSLTMLCTRIVNGVFQDNNIFLKLMKSFQEKADADGKIEMNEIRGV